MVGVFISVWMKMEFLTKYCISNVKVSSVACGLWVTWGIKVQFQIACLLKEPAFASLLLTWLLARREVMKAGGITKSQRFSEELHSPTSSEDDDNPHPITILGHESRIFWFGDLNYRLYQDNILAKEFIKKQDWKALQEFDQLRKELEDGGVF
ncbi:TYPE IV INOSITOL POLYPHOSPHATE 5-PHOSPHATASE 7-LIKE [Salix koriyanagi]|uniref:TYPE IV INOSITOL POLYPHOSPHATE 5-PHOSPHATASE 7-LIKE n=1 Tax=Salix koriyanagi TaxID=2511006 RepID=A0A9Q0SW75_9ROSI|nr:TYPE IV INOSITOL POLYPHOSPHATE 5-PHOSPHATASE 7-LIKE [Salix koriyanagi]